MAAKSSDFILVETTINAHTKARLPEESLARIIKDMELPLEYAAQIYSFFTDVPLPDIDKFTTRYGIEDKVLKKYYLTYIKNIYPNPGLEEMLAYAY
ncbi:Uncharacterized [Moorella glycerini]|uniref:Uncharacterized protein n=1 Tax=Neomoorella stamsii TaxID=1266720 RepID=A0A9X7P5H0_9FIRM|nr:MULTISPECIES: hypothetical protein [Moorella]PRR71502.1 hypothetical protein MOST_25580 [Moorella stamsii]CEP68713.1 Uncharacterized [Moorella glycerini]